MASGELRYQAGFGNTFSTEAERGALPRRQNSPRKVPFDLIAEQLNGTGFTVRRAENQRTWLYRLRPSIHAKPWEPRPHERFVGRFSRGVSSPEVMRWRPLEAPPPSTDWLDGLMTFGGAGDPATRTGVAFHLYTANTDMQDRVFCNVDGDMLLIPELGAMQLQTEMGWLHLVPGEIAIVPCGVRFAVRLPERKGRGFVAEVFGTHLRLPERGPVGANGMADARHFLAPVAAWEDRGAETELIVKQSGSLWRSSVPFSPFDVVAWHGNYAPFKYDLRLYNSMGSVSFDHPDPSLLTVLTAPWDDHGRSAFDLVAFVGRWDVAENTFRPPFFHRNAATEFNGVLQGSDSGPFSQGTFTWTPYLSPHGVSARSYNGVVALPDDTANRPSRGGDESIWIQFESTFLVNVMPWMIDHPCRDAAYLKSFAGYKPATVKS